MLLNGKGLPSANRMDKPAKDILDCSEPPPMEKLNWLMHLQHIRGEIDFCKKIINLELARSDGKNEYAFFKQGSILKQEGYIQEALEIFQKCLKLNPDNAIILREMAKCLYDMRRFRLAVNAYLEAESLLKNPDWKLCYFIAQCYLKLGNIEKAKEYAHKSVKMGKQEESYGLLMKILVSERDLKSAIAVSNAATECCPDSVNMLTESGLLYLKAGQSQYAFERLSQALALEPSHSKALLGIGCITMKHEEFDVALTKFKIAVLHEPESVALWNNIGVCFYAKQKFVAAISCLKRALWIAPLNWKIIYNLALVYLATQQPASAFNFACAAVNLRPDVAECFALLGYTLFYLKDAENALKALSHACASAPNDVTMTANAALLTAVTGDFKSVLNYTKKYHELVETGENVPNEVSRLMESLAPIHQADQTGQADREDGVVDINETSENVAKNEVVMEATEESGGKYMEEDEV